MAVCDYCGTTYRGGAAVHGKLRFCTHQCRDRGKVLEVLDHVAPSVVDQEIERVRLQPCPECGALTGVDIHKSHRIWSAMIYTTWRSTSHFCCQSCGRKHQLKSLAFSGLLGWWMPIGLLITPFQIMQNVKGMLRRGDRASNDLQRSVRIDFAQRLLERASRRGN
jgi:hypothetical protein